MMAAYSVSCIIHVVFLWWIQVYVDLNLFLMKLPVLILCTLSVPSNKKNNNNVWLTLYPKQTLLPEVEHTDVH